MKIGDVVSYGTMVALAGSIIYGAETRYAHQNDMIVVQIQSYEYCQKILRDLQKQITTLELTDPGSSKLAELRKRLAYFEKVCGKQ